MKISISSPDGVGDFVLRTVLFKALIHEGHELQIFMRPPADDLARELLPEARIETIIEDPYSRLIRFRRNPFAAERALLSRFDPHLLVVALFQHSFFDEVVLATRKRRMRVAGFRCKGPFWGSEANTAPESLANCFNPAVEVEADLPELEKNRLLAEAILRRSIASMRVQLSPSAENLAAARQRMALHNLDEGRYLVVCVGARAGLEIKDWGESNWNAALSAIGKEAGVPLVFIGNRSESDSIERIRMSLPPDIKHVNLALEPPSILTSFGIIALSESYVGRDSGPMHLAAAAGKPILAISSGWLWGRFFPEGPQIVIVSRHVPCQGCLGFCHLPEPFCVRRVTVEQFLEGWRMMRSATLARTEIMEIPMDDQLVHEIAATAHLRYAPFVQSIRREGFESGRAVNFFDTAGILLRRLARAGYRGKFCRHSRKSASK